MLSDALALCFWACLLLVAFAYAVYPLLIFVFACLFGRAAGVSPAIGREPDGAAGERGAPAPAVSLLIAAHNEEAAIEARILNALALDYPAGRLEIVIASDGSTDGTDDIVRRYAGRGVRLLAYAVNQGKAVVLDKSVPRLAGQIVILSDANTHMEPDAARRLVAWFADPAVGVVCGRLVLTDARTGKNADGLYWKYETFLKKCESRLGALLGSNGAIYAIRKDLFPGVSPGTIIDDFVIPLAAKRRSGCRILYDTRAVAHEETAPTLRAEFRRRVRIGAGGFQSIGLLWPLLLPTNGWVAFTFFSHKVLRWACPFFLIGMLVANVALLGTRPYDFTLAAQGGFYLLAALGNWVPTRPRFLKCLRLPTMFVSMNAALFLGFFRWFFGQQGGTWKRTERAPDGANPLPGPQTVELGR
ncbi:glycosyltransferase family 2 protein [Frigoriglobus tundricola]|uniref:GT2 family glycosyltransferase n=1 Tax=Frigoriglobus tundricola TaxID=2774151 RepID=A0A6M5YYU6_9BACT|nr:glycosyltransferase family 2 protein [Frigoriglobus tundricola]QJW98072.1 GT2 family glycosyltransferase [Frigoriglobus tundricola]